MTVTGTARLVLIWRYFVRSVVLVDTGFTVDPCGVLRAVDTNPSSAVLPGSVKASPFLCNIVVIVTVFGFVVTVTFFTLVTGGNGSGPPGLLMEAGAAPVTALTTRIMFTLTLKLLCFFIPGAAASMAGAYAHASNGDVFYRVVITSCDNRVEVSEVPMAKGHEVCVERSDALQAKTYVPC